MLHEGSGELHTVTGADLLRSHPRRARSRTGSGVGLIGAEAMLRLFAEQEANERAFAALTRFLDLLDERRAGATRAGARPARALVPAEAPLALRLPAARRHCVECGATGRLVGFSARAGGAVCAAHAAGAFALSPDGVAGMERCFAAPLADARSVGP